MTKDNRYEKYKPIYDEWIKLYPFSTESLDGEIWQVIPNYEDYQGSNFGRVKSFYFGRKPQLSSDGYLSVVLCKNGKHKYFRLNVLVGKLFIPNPENKPEVNHRYSRFSNHVDCLEWATSAENMQHAVRTGLHKSGEESVKAKLTNEQVIYIRENPDGLTQEKLAEMFGVSRRTIADIQRGGKYRNAGGTIRETQKPGDYHKVSVEKREKILADYQRGVKGHGYSAVGKRFGVDVKTVWRIVNGR